MKKSRLALPLALALCACGTNSLNTPKKLGLTDKKDQGQKACGTATPPAQHKITVRSNNGFPEKIGIKLPKENDFRLSDCGTYKQDGMSVSWDRSAGSGNRTVVLTFDHNGKFTANGRTDLPNEQAFEIWDMKGCGSNPAPALLWKPDAPPTIYWKLYPGSGGVCAQGVIGEGSITSTFVEADVAEYWAR